MHMFLCRSLFGRRVVRCRFKAVAREQKMTFAEMRKNVKLVLIYLMYINVVRTKNFFLGLLISEIQRHGSGVGKSGE